MYRRLITNLVEPEPIENCSIDNGKPKMAGGRLHDRERKSVKSNGEINAKLTEVVAAGAVSALGYALVVAYEVGYCTYFIIPFAWIEASVVSILLVVGVLLVSAFPVFGLYGIFQTLLGSPSPVAQALRRSMRPLLWMGGMYWVTGLIYEPLYYRTVLIFTGVILLIEFIPPIFRKKDGNSYLDRLKTSVDRYDRAWSGDDDYFSRLPDRIGVTLYRWIVLSGLALLLTYQVGQGHARAQEEFFVVRDTNLVVLRMYGERIITAPLKANGSTVEPVFTILAGKPNSDATQVFALKRLGRIRVDR